MWFQQGNKVEIHRDVSFPPEIAGELSAQEEIEDKAEIQVQQMQQTQENEEEAKNDNNNDLEQVEENHVEEREDAAQEPQIPDAGRAENQLYEQHQPAEQAYGLRNRANLNRPARFDQYIVDIAEICFAEGQDPVTYEKAVHSSDADLWKNAMSEEMALLMGNKTWQLVKPPADAKVLQNRWVFRKKPTLDGLSTRYKARLIVKGFSQRPGIDFEETFSPVAKYASIRAVLSLAAASGMHLVQFDIKTVFLNGDLEENIFMAQPKGFDDGTGRGCKLEKALYGLKQSARCWNRKFVHSLEKVNLKPSEADPCIFTAENGGEKLMLAIYIDDGLVATTCKQKAEELLDYLNTELEITVTPLHLYLGMEIEQPPDRSLFSNQSKYTQKILRRFRMEDAHTVAIPADQHQDLSLQNINDEEEPVQAPYREAVGSLLYLATVTRPDIAYAVHAVSQYCESPKKVHWHAIKRILKYIKGTSDYGLWFPYSKNKIKLEAYSDADFAGDKTTRKSTTGFFIKFGKIPIVWGSQKQTSVSMSTTESEYIAASETVRELIWILRLFRGLVKDKIEKPIMLVDNQSAIKLVKNPEFHRKTKHIEVRYHFVRNAHEEKVFDLDYINTNNQIADILTKPLSRDRFEYLRTKLGVIAKKEVCQPKVGV